jgi:hypothetical protein
MPASAGGGRRPAVLPHRLRADVADLARLIRRARRDVTRERRRGHAQPAGASSASRLTPRIPPASPA